MDQIKWNKIHSLLLRSLPGLGRNTAPGRSPPQTQQHAHIEDGDEWQGDDGRGKEEGEVKQELIVAVLHEEDARRIPVAVVPVHLLAVTHRDGQSSDEHHEPNTQDGSEIEFARIRWGSGCGVCWIRSWLCSADEPNKQCVCVGLRRRFSRWMVASFPVHCWRVTLGDAWPRWAWIKLVSNSSKQRETAPCRITGNGFDYITMVGTTSGGPIPQLSKRFGSWIHIFSFLSGAVFIKSQRFMSSHGARPTLGCQSWLWNGNGSLIKGNNSPSSSAWCPAQPSTQDVINWDKWAA